MMEESMKNQVKQQFSRNAEKYVTSARHAKGEDLAWLVSCAKANANMNVLDIATGGGHVANALAPLVRHVTAYDLTREMLEAAERFIGGNGYTNVSYVTGDAEQLPFEDESFDLVTCRIAAHHFTDIPVFAAEALRVATPGGKLLLIDNVAPEQDHLDQFYNDIEKFRDARPCPGMEEVGVDSFTRKHRIPHRDGSLLPETVPVPGLVRAGRTSARGERRLGEQAAAVCRRRTPVFLDQYE